MPGPRDKRRHGRYGEDGGTCCRDEVAGAAAVGPRRGDGELHQDVLREMPIAGEHTGETQ